MIAHVLHAPVTCVSGAQPAGGEAQRQDERKPPGTEGRKRRYCWQLKENQSSMRHRPPAPRLGSPCLRDSCQLRAFSSHERALLQCGLCLHHCLLLVLQGLHSKWKPVLKYTLLWGCRALPPPSSRKQTGGTQKPADSRAAVVLF